MMRLGLLCLFFLVGWPIDLRAEDKPKPAWRVSAECQMVIVPPALALEIVPELLEEATVEKAWGKIKTEIAERRAKLVAQITLKANIGEKATSETVEEVRYPTEFEQPQLPNNILNEPSPEKVAEALKNWPLVGFVPTAFETRNVGATLELETKSDDGESLAVQLEARHVRFLRFAKYDAGVLASGEHLTIDQPIFHTCRTILDFNMRSGRLVLIGTHTLPAEEGVELFLLRLTTQPNAAKP